MEAKTPLYSNHAPTTVLQKMKFIMLVICESGIEEESTFNCESFFYRNNMQLT